jgi:hypothetical protein
MVGQCQAITTLPSGGKKDSIPILQQAAIHMDRSRSVTKTIPNVIRSILCTGEKGEFTQLKVGSTETRTAGLNVLQKIKTSQKKG